MNILKKLFYTEHTWNVGILNNFSQESLISQDLHKLNQNIFWIGPKNTRDFYADPMVTEYFGKPILFIEEWVDAEKKKGLFPILTLLIQLI